MSTIDFPTELPTADILDAVRAIKDGAANTPAGKNQIAKAGWLLVGWALGRMASGKSNGYFFHAGQDPAQGLTDDEAQELLDQLANPPEQDGSLKAVVCPISPATALKLAAWLLKAVEIVLPVLL